jgi:hypothetical protein
MEKLRFLSSDKKNQTIGTAIFIFGKYNNYDDDSFRYNFYKKKINNRFFDDKIMFDFLHEPKIFIF